MKKLYYFSKSKLQFVEIQNFKVKLTAALSLTVMFLGLIVFGIYFLISAFSASSGDVLSLKEENEYLRNKLKETTSLYSRLNKELEGIAEVNNDLRIAANLPPISDEERRVGVGGGYFDNEIDFIKNPGDDLSAALKYIDEISRKINFEKEQYNKIEKKLVENRRLSEAIPAIVPCSGSLAEHGFGLRVHPILRVKKMHEGIDIITDVGTKVYASGKGTVAFVGYRGGFGLAIEIDHGFGYRTIYAHLSGTNVKEGQKVLRGDMIARTGNTGLSSGPHLHYEVHHDGVKKDPSEFFFDNLGFFELKPNNVSTVKK